jgi:hypothetical protein
VEVLCGTHNAGLDQLTESYKLNYLVSIMIDISMVGVILGSSVFAALLTQGLSTVRDWWGKRKRSQLSGLHLALELEAYGRLCSHNLSEQENYESSDGHAGS